MDQIHTPERLENETMYAYHARRRISRLVANRWRKVPEDRIDAPKPKVARRLLTEKLGVRQTKKLLRKLKAARAAHLAGASA